MKKAFKFLFVVVILISGAIATETEKFGGLGISVWTSKNGVEVAGVIPNSPAENIGLQAGDLIVSANGTEFSSVEPSLQVNYLRGEAGSTVNLVVERGGEKITLSVKRVDISVQNLEANVISMWYGKNSGLSAEEISHLANQKIDEGYDLLGVMQYGMPIARNAENLNVEAVQHVSVKKTVEKIKLPDVKVVVLNDQKKLSLVNAKGIHVKKQNSLLLYRAK
ncbi:MAG: PDZ domain-containing protein [Fibromonadaceae bacterium]|jgi:C-terminal processing protease CtpA/Prc|nr:PDZ domain-containing protein [Fibromonadaceae bacterium]